jgi:hypothetical protein
MIGRSNPDQLFDKVAACVVVTSKDLVVKHLFAAALLSMSCVLVAACGGGGGGGGSSPPPVAQEPPPTQPPPAVDPPAPSGQAVNVPFEEGDYLEYSVRTESSSIVQGSGSEQDFDAGLLRVTLGAARRIGTVDLFPIVVSGTTLVGGTEFSPRWKYLGASNGKLLGSIDGQSVQTLYSPTGASMEGFFTTFDAGTTSDIKQATFAGDYIQTSALQAGVSKSSGGCQIVAGIRVCSDDAESISSGELFKDGIGPLGFRYSTSSTSNGGGFYTSFSTRYEVQLVRTSLDTSALTVQEAPGQAASMSVAHADVLATVHGGKIYVFGRSASPATTSTDIEVYDPATDRWTIVGTTATSLSGYVVATIDDISYFVGSGPLRAYNHVTSTWSTLTTVNPIGPRAHSGELDWKVDVKRNFAGQGQIYLAQTERYLLAVNGVGQRKTAITLKSYLPGENLWRPVGTYTASSFEMDTMNFVADALFLTGGRNVSPIRFDLLVLQATDQGLARPADRESSAAFARWNERIYCFGGSGKNSDFESVDYRRESEYFDTSSNSWTAIPKLLLGRAAAAAVVLNGKIYVIGGRIAGNTATNRVEVYSLPQPPPA